MAQPFQFFMCLSKGNEAYVYVGICTQMLPEALFVIAIS